jgi:hypothetical protein
MNPEYGDASNNYESDDGKENMQDMWSFDPKLGKQGPQFSGREIPHRWATNSKIGNLKTGRGPLVRNAPTNNIAGNMFQENGEMSRIPWKQAVMKHAKFSGKNKNGNVNPDWRGVPISRQDKPKDMPQGMPDVEEPPPSNQEQDDEEPVEKKDEEKKKEGETQETTDPYATDTTTSSTTTLWTTPAPESDQYLDKGELWYIDYRDRYNLLEPFQIAGNMKKVVDLENLPLCRCPRVYWPACATNNITYINICILNCLGKTMRRYGTCINYRRLNDDVVDVE